MSNSKNKSNHNYAGLNIPELKNSFNTLLANIRFASLDSDIKSIAIVASGVNEGKTTVSLNLAFAIRSSGKRCLLIEGDMRKRSLSGYLNVHAKYGIYSVLSGKCLPQEAVIHTELSNIDFLDCEPNISAPPDILSTNRFAQLVRYYRKIYDFIIVDTPPLLSFVDGALIANRVDATIVVIREGKARRNDVDTILKQLDTAKANILGTVLTFSTNTAENDYYYAYYNKENKRVKNKHKTLEDDNYVSEVQQKSNLNTWFDPSISGGFSRIPSGAHTHEDLKTPFNKDSVSDTNESYDDTQIIQKVQGAHYDVVSAADSSPFEPIEKQNNTDESFKDIS